MEHRDSVKRRRIAAVVVAMGGAGMMASLGLAAARNDDGANTFFLSSAIRRSVEAVETAAPMLTISRPARVAFRHEAKANHRRTMVAVASPRTKRAPAPVAIALLPKDKTAALRSAAPVFDGMTPVAIYTDKTLRAGDAVMMADGIRVFRGSPSFPYSKTDFVSVDTAQSLARLNGRIVANGKTVAALDTDRKS